MYNKSPKPAPINQEITILDTTSSHLVFIIVWDTWGSGDYKQASFVTAAGSFGWSFYA